MPRVKVDTDSGNDVELHYEDYGEGPWPQRQVSTAHAGGSSLVEGRTVVHAGRAQRRHRDQGKVRGCPQHLNSLA